MTVVFRAHGTCPVCGCRNQGVLTATVRVHKHTLISQHMFGFLPEACIECRHPLGQDLFTRLVLNPDDAQKVRAYRQRKGWAA